MIAIGYENQNANKMHIRYDFHTVMKPIRSSLNIITYHVYTIWYMCNYCMEIITCAAQVFMKIYL